MLSEKDIIQACNLAVSSNKGITLEEKYLLKGILKITQTDHKNLKSLELVTLAKRTIFRTLGRDNITPRDLKKEIVNLIEI